MNFTVGALPGTSLYDRVLIRGDANVNGWFADLRLPMRSLQDVDTIFDRIVGFLAQHTIQQAIFSPADPLRGRK